MKVIEEASNHILRVGHPETAPEYQEMFQLRTEEYQRKGYINGEDDKDEYDLTSSVYFIAKAANGKIIGTLRLIVDNPLPTEIYFDFEEPKEIKAIPEDERAEISRLIAAAGDINHILLWNLIKAVVKFGRQNNLRSGYAFIKRGLGRIIRGLGIPIHVIRPFTLKYDEDLLKGYFYHGSQVLPIYYLREKVAEAMEKKEAKVMAAS